MQYNQGNKQIVGWQKNSATSNPYGLVGTPSGFSVSIHHLVPVNGDAWTITLSVWNIGGGA